MIKKCAGFDMNMLCYDPAYENHDYIKAIQENMDLRQARGIPREKNWIKYVKFEDALREADFVSVHVPLLRPGESTTPTYHLFNEQTLRLMKPTAFLVNDSRGPVIDEVALARALRENWIAGAALDVYEKEPLPADSPLRDPAIADRCRLMPALCQRSAHHAPFHRSQQRHGGAVRARIDGRTRGELSRRYYENALCREQRSVREVAAQERDHPRCSPIAPTGSSRAIA